MAGAFVFIESARLNCYLYNVHICFSVTTAYVTADSGVRLYTRKDDVGVRIMCAGKGWFSAYWSVVSNILVFVYVHFLPLQCGCCGLRLPHCVNRA